MHLQRRTSSDYSFFDGGVGWRFGRGLVASIFMWWQGRVFWAKIDILSQNLRSCELDVSFTSIG